MTVGWQLAGRLSRVGRSALTCHLHVTTYQGDRLTASARPAHTGAMETITITIGRNVGNRPLDKSAWLLFADSTLDACQTFATFATDAQVVFYGFGAGIWEGAREDAYTVIALADTDTDDTGHAHRQLIRDLRNLAREYRQDCIAVTTGQTELVSPQ